MREKLNENPVAQVVLIGILAVVGVVIFIGQGGEEEEGESASSTQATVAVAGSGESATATGATPGEAVESAVSSLEAGGATASATAPPASVPTPTPPRPFVKAYDSGKTVALLIVHPGSIDSVVTARFTRVIAPLPDVKLFVIKARQIARYAAVTVGLEVNRVPALIVLQPKKLSKGTPQGTVEYGLQTPQSVIQSVLDANYKGRELAYHPN